MAADPVVALSWIQRLDTVMQVVYEAGPTGYF